MPAWIYFFQGRRPKLTLPEAALIAGLRRPRRCIRHARETKNLALQRRALCWPGCGQAGFHQRFRAEREAEATPLRLQPALPSTGTSEAPYFTSWVAKEANRMC